MSNCFRASVTIPVYNAAPYLMEAVESALSQPETAEIILVEDHSSDNSLEICQQLAARNNMIRLYRHDDGKNHGCSASRNLAIRNSVCEYIAFLDADDYFLPGRFVTARQMFEAEPELDGVYEAIEMHVEDEVSLERWKTAGRAPTRLHTISQRISPENLFIELVAGKSFSIDGLIIRRRALDKCGYLNESLPLHGDDIFFIMLAATARLAPGSLDVPVARWRVHGQNRISAPRPQRDVYQLRIKFWNILWEWSRSRLEPERQQLLLRALLNDARLRKRFSRSFPKKFTGLIQRMQLLLLPSIVPTVLLEPTYWRSFFPHSLRQLAFK